MNVTRMAEETKELRQECKTFTSELKHKLLLQDPTLPIQEQDMLYRRTKEKNIKVQVKEQIDNIQALEGKRRREENNLKGPGNWLAAPPTKATHHYLTKREFKDAIRLRIGMKPREMAEKYAC